MAYRIGDRYQTTLFPASIEDYVSPNDPVRAYDAFVEMADCKELGIIIDPNHVGNSAYDPKAMLKLLVYGYSYGYRSSRKLERAVHHNVSFIWLMGGLQPDHKTIARFRSDNKEALKQLLRQCAKLCIRLNLIEGNTLFLDGTKIRANAGIGETYTQERAEKYLQRIDERIAEIVKESETIDHEEEGHSSLVELNEELQDKERLKKKVQQILNDLKKEDAPSSINATDPDCVKVHSRQGNHAGYNGQLVVDGKHGLIVHSDVVTENNDLHQFAHQIDQANDVLEHPCQNAVADGGYDNVSELKKIDDKGITVIVPPTHGAITAYSPGFEKKDFQYDATTDTYTCPAGQVLNYSYHNESKHQRIYRMNLAGTCHACTYYTQCTKAKRGRSINRLDDEETKIRLETIYNKPSSQRIYVLRKEKVELPFGHIKRNLGVSAFLLRGLAGVRAEMALFASCFNLTRMIRIMGIQPFMHAMANG